MSELIDREQAGKNICKYCASNAYCKEDDCMVYQGLRDTPTIQIEAEPVRHGRWILERKPDGTPYCLHCSECDPDFAVIYNVVATDYCPDCGAKMETDRVYERDDYDETD